jgi:hypothetical protein
MAVYRLPGGGKIRAFAPPPKGFDPLKAKGRELARYGFPPRPKKNELLLKQWEDAFRQKLQYVEAELEPVGRPSHDRRPSPVVFGGPTPPYEHASWAGAVLSTSAAAPRFAGVNGWWTVPKITTPSNISDGKPYHFIAWVGIGTFYYGAMVFRAGYETTVTNTKNQLSASSDAFFSWQYGERRTYVTDPIPNNPSKHVLTQKTFPVKIGDSVRATLWLESNDHANGRVWFFNYTTGKGAFFKAKSPLGPAGPLDTSEVEWIVERPIDPNSSEPTDLASFEPFLFQTALAMQADTYNLVDPFSPPVDANGNPMEVDINMVVQNKTLAVGTVPAQNQVQVVCKI